MVPGQLSLAISPWVNGIGVFMLYCYRNISLFVNFPWMDKRRKKYLYWFEPKNLIFGKLKGKSIFSVGTLKVFVEILAEGCNFLFQLLL